MTKAAIKATKKILADARTAAKNAKTEAERHAAEVVIDECEKALESA